MLNGISLQSMEKEKIYERKTTRRIEFFDLIYGFFVGLIITTPILLLLLLLRILLQLFQQ